jgi:hypothetical protein
MLKDSLSSLRGLIARLVLRKSSTSTSDPSQDGNIGSMRSTSKRKTEGDDGGCPAKFPILELPEDVLFSVLQQLHCRDLAAVSQVFFHIVG